MGVFAGILVAVLSAVPMAVAGPTADTVKRTLQVGSGSCTAERLDTEAYSGLLAEGQAVCVFSTFTVRGDRIEVHHAGGEQASSNTLIIAAGDVTLEQGSQALRLESLTLEGRELK